MTTNTRKDSLERYFIPIGIINNVNIVLFWISVILSFGLLYLNGFPTSWVNILFITTTILYFILDNYGSLLLMLNGENRRRRHLISKSFDVPLDTENTDLYYNNSENPSIRKLAANTLENTLFTFTNTNQMVIRERIKVIGYLIIWLILILNRQTSLEVLAIIGQTIFSSSLISNWIKLEILNKNTERIHNDLYHIFLQINGDNVLDNHCTARFLDLVMEYECLKIGMNLNLSANIFKKINPPTTIKWNSMKQLLHIKN